jgi:3-methyladenine DNA glycosylase AlkD
MTPTDLDAILRELHEIADAERVASLQRFFRTGPGEYGEGDRFLGLRVPEIRRLARRHRTLPLERLALLLGSPWHEERLLALLILVEQYRRGDLGARESIHRLYLDQIAHVDNWDLVDVSAEHIVGAHLTPNDLGLLDGLAHSDSLWERRIAILATFYWIRRDEFGPTLRIAAALLDDRHDLIHKAVGWMLREVGKRDEGRLDAFLREHYRRMPRTMLRYAIERLPEPRRQLFLRGAI